MDNARPTTWLYRWLLKHNRCHQSVKQRGFTLLEILVSLIIAGIVMSGLLYLVVELLQIDRRELALEQVQRDMQRAMEYVTDDLKEAVYIYSTPTDITDALNDTALDAEIVAGAVPVLAFWRVDELDTSPLPADCTTAGANSTTCELIKTRRASYTLVVYYQRPQYGSWEGETTLKRYQLTQYNDLATDYTLNPGYADPVTGATTNFEAWAPSGNADGTSAVLVDYVQALSTTTTANAVNCANLINASNTPLTGESVTATDYILAPANAASNTGAYACVRNTGAQDFRTNQDLYLFLQGNVNPANTTNSFLQPASESSRLPLLQTQVKLGGVVNRSAD